MKKINRRQVISAIILLFNAGILFSIFLIYWTIISADFLPPYSYYLTAIGICILGISLIVLIESKKNMFSLIINPFSLNRVKRDRLMREIMVLRNEIESAILTEKNNEALTKEAKENLTKAELAAEDHQFEKSWGHVVNADYQLVSLIDDKDTDKLNKRANLIIIESSKIKSGWRVKQIKALLGDECKLKNITKSDLSRAMTIRNDYYLTRNHKMNLHSVNVNILTSVLALIIITLLILSFFLDFKYTEGATGSRLFVNLLLCALFGILGSGFSFGRTLFSYDPETSKIPEQMLGMAVTTTRFLIGAAAAIIVFILFQAGFMTKLFSESILQGSYTYLVFSFMAGFSERWVVKMLNLVTDEKK